MVKTMIVNGQLSTVLDMKTTELIIQLLEDLDYLKAKNRVSITLEEVELLEKLKATPSHAIIHRNT